MPLPGSGLTWFEFDELGFDERFLLVLSFITPCLTLVGRLVFPPVIASWSIARIVAVLTVVRAVLALPSFGLSYGFHDWRHRAKRAWWTPISSQFSTRRSSRRSVRWR